MQPIYQVGAYVETRHLSVGDTLTSFDSAQQVWITYRQSLQAQYAVFSEEV